MVVKINYLTIEEINGSFKKMSNERRFEHQNITIKEDKDEIEVIFAICIFIYSKLFSYFLKVFNIRLEIGAIQLRIFRNVIFLAINK